MTGTIYVQQDPTDGTWDASVAELPGVYARGASREEAVAKAKAAFRAYLELLAARDVNIDHWKDLDPEKFAVKDPERRFTYPEDFEKPVEEHEVRDFLHRLEASRGTLLALVGGLSSDETERRPTESMWSVREALEHIMFTEASLLGKLERWPEGDFATLQAVRRIVYQRFAVMEPEKTVDHEISGRRWGTRKVMRRILEHEYEHMGHIREILAALGGDRQPS